MYGKMSFYDKEHLTNLLNVFHNLNDRVSL